MQLSDGEIRRIGEEAARKVIDRLGVVPKSYRKPANVFEGLQDSVHEEKVASAWYRERAMHADNSGDPQTASLYREIAGEEDHHALQFEARETQIFAANPLRKVNVFTSGDRVKITSGSFEGREGTVLQIGGRSTIREGSTMYLVNTDRKSNEPDIRQYFNDFELEKV